MKKKYKIISEDLMNNIIDFLDEVQFDAAKSSTNEDMHKINFCSWAIKELLNSYDGYLRQTPKKKTRDDYVDETFLDWNLPEMSDEEFEKLVDTFDAFLRGWEKEYLKKNPQKKPKTQTDNKSEFKPRIEDVAEYCSLDEIEEMLKDDPELTDNERFELYYDERERMKEREKLKKSQTLDEMLKDLNIKPSSKK